MEKILIAEDDIGIRTGIKYLLMNEGYEIKEAVNGNEAIHLVKNENFDLILSDVMMPDKDGYEFFAEIKKDELLSSIPFLFLTAKSTHDDFRKGMNLGVDDYITKPFKAEELLLAINTRLKKKRNLDERFENLKNGITKYVPHELRTPLVSILGYTDLILQDFREETPEIILEMVDRISVAGNRLLRTIEKFLILTQIKSEIKLSNNNPCGAECPDFSIAHVFSNVQERLLKIYSNNILIDAEIKECLVRIPEKYFEILITELLDNAIKFSSPNGIVKINSKLGKDNCSIQIINNGREFSEAQIKKVSEFMQFEREEFQQNGNGLGLPIVRSILALIGGGIEIKSKNNITTISARIPLKK